MALTVSGDKYITFAADFEPELFRSAQMFDADFGAKSCKIVLPPTCTSDLDGSVSFTATWSSAQESSYKMRYTTWPRQISYQKALDLGMSNKHFHKLRGPLLTMVEQRFEIVPRAELFKVSRAVLFCLMTGNGAPQQPLSSFDMQTPLEATQDLRACIGCYLGNLICSHEAENNLETMQINWDVTTVQRLADELHKIGEAI